DTTGGWASYIAGAYISDGSTVILGTVTDNALTFGDAASMIFSVAEAGYKDFTLSIYLEDSLPVGADRKVLGFDLDPNDDISITSLSSGMGQGDSITSSTYIEITATKFIVSGSVGTVAAGIESSVYMKAVDVNNNIDVNYSGAKQIVFSGANDAVSNDVPMCNNVDFGDVTAIGFANGRESTDITMVLFRAEGAAIKAQDALDTSIVTSYDDDLEILVIGGAASQLSWETQPVATVVANAAWNRFRVSVTDAYGNRASGARTVTITPNGGTAGAESVNSAVTESGIANFSDFQVYCAAYPGIVTLTAGASGVVDSNASNVVTVEEKYDITLRMLDYTTGGGLTELDLNILDADGFQASQSGLTNPMSGNSPLSCYLTSGIYQFAFTKEAYVDYSVEKAAGTAADGMDGTYDNAITWTIYLTSIAESLSDYAVQSDFIYDETADLLNVTMRLEKRGQQIVSDNVNALGAGTVNIFDADTLVGTLTDSAADAQGNYWFNVEHAVAGVDGQPSPGLNEVLISGKTYYARCVINYGGETGDRMAYTSGTTFTITVTQGLKEVTDAVATVT
ncbi:MAG: hypothetical protein KAI72_02880, partial [Candidatus Pacebacteria bacterium]|nr:hypothetical protein [Candidatus Paceibacterota bacterium]